jgi:LuxR family maltose regulon positive regulatory protein
LPQRVARNPERSAFEPIATKLQPPRPRRGVVQRTRLVERLERSGESRFVSVVAPAGYGKTTVLGQWAARDARPFAWLSLDHRDNDPVVLLSYLGEALNAGEALAPRVLEALHDTSSVWSSGLPQLGAALAAREQPVVLVLDDVHELQADESLDALAALALHVPPGSQIVFAGRSAPRIGLAKMRAEGGLYEVDARLLALDDGEAAALLAAAGADLTPTEASELNRHAEGWAAGLYLAALSIAGGAAAASFDGSDRFVTDYLRAEELSQIDKRDTDFLLRTSVLERMSGPLCDAVLAKRGSAAVLERLESGNLFVVALDNTRTWFRYHHLFREMLLAELERTHPGDASELRRRAAAWCEAAGLTEEAIDYAAAGDDTETLTRLVADEAFDYFRAGRVSTVERWLESFDDRTLLGANPEIAVFGAWLHALRGRISQAERWAYALESAAPGTVSDGTSIDALAAATRALMCRDGIEEMQRQARAAVEGMTLANPLRPGALLLAGVATLLLEEDGAEEILEQAAVAASAGNAVWAGLVARSELALIALERRDLTAAEAQAALAHEFVEGSQSADYVMTAIGNAVSARIAIALGRGAQARQALAAAQRLRPMLTHAVPWFAVQVLLELAEAHLELGDPRGAATLHREAAEILHRRPRLGALVERAAAIEARIPATPDAAVSGWAATLTAAELRLLPLLTTHLSFREIAERLFVSRNTVKTQAISIYRKLDATSRSEAIERAIALGLVDAAPGARGPDFIRPG